LEGLPKGETLACKNDLDVLRTLSSEVMGGCIQNTRDWPS
jgi:hypothetical protein